MGAQKVYRRATPYPKEALFAIDAAQTADLLYTVHGGYPPQKLERYGHTDWRWSTVTFGPIIPPPTGMSVTPVTPNTTGVHMTNYGYVITGISESAPVQESRQSAQIVATNDLSLAGNYNQITLPALGIYDRFVIYKFQGGSYGYIGNTKLGTFHDENIIPVMSETPLEGYNPFVGAGNYPTSVGLHQQRLAFGGTYNVINGIWLSRSADFENMDKSRPLRSDDSMLFSLVANEVNAITHLVSLKELVVLTGDGLWAVSGGGDNAAITPSSVMAQRETGRGAVRVKPLLVDEVVFYITSKGRLLRTLGFSFEIDGYKSDNVSIFAPHLFTQSGVIRIAYQEEPHACVYCLRDNGTIIALTWEIDQEVWGWSQFEIDGFVEDICVIGESGYDRLYAIIRRTINGVVKRNLERMALPGTNLNACHLDCSATFIQDPAIATVSGLHHLEGATVSATYNGYVSHGLTVVGGKVSVPEASNQISVGLRYEGLIETLSPVLTSRGGTMHVETQQVTDVVVRVLEGKGLSVGITGYEDSFEQLSDNVGDNVLDHRDYTMTDFMVNLPGDWKESSTVLIKQTEPFPAQVVGAFLGLRVAP